MIRELAAAVADALADEGLRVALRAGDVTPPVVFVQLGAVDDAGAMLAGGLIVTFWCHYIPVRGVDNLEGDADSLDAMFRALRPLAMTGLAAGRTSVTLTNETYPCWRADLAALALEPSEVR